MDAILRVDGLTKDFGRLRALDRVSFSIERGQVVGLLGPNGAGKTTCIDILLGATLPQAGRIEYFGRDFFKDKQAALRRINFASAYHSLQNRTSVRENLLVFAGLYEVSDRARKIESLIDYFQIRDIADRRFGDCSAGQRTRVNLIKSLLNDPELILMDEPTASLDPDIADKTLSLIEELRRERNLSILFTSHNMEEVARICDEVIFLDHGQVVTRGTPAELTRQLSDAELSITFTGDPAVVAATFRAHDVAYQQDGSTVHATLHEREIARLIVALDGAGIAISDIDVRKANLEDVFIQIARGNRVV